jgi:hypothetical protein
MTERKYTLDDFKWYFDMADRLVDVWGWDVQQISNTLLYHAKGVNILKSNQHVDHLGAEIYSFISRISSSIEAAKILFPQESVKHLDMFVQILGEINHPSAGQAIMYLNRIKVWFKSPIYLSDQRIPLLTAAEV